jgi:hemerythrin
MTDRDNRPTDFDDLRDQIAEVADTLHRHVAREELIIADAFPNGDVAGHRAAHDQMIAASKAETEFWRELKLDLAKKGLWGLLVLVLGFAMLGLSVKFGLAGK